MDPTSPSGRLRARRESRHCGSWGLGALLAAAAVGYAAYQLMPVPDAIWQRRVALALDDSTDVYLLFWRAMLQPVAGLVYRFAPARFLFRAKSQLYWAGREGAWTGWTEAEVWALRLVGGTLGLMFSFLLNSDSALIWVLPAAIPIMALYFMPYVAALVIPMILPTLGGF